MTQRYICEPVFLSFCLSVFCMRLCMKLSEIMHHATYYLQALLF